MGCEGAVAGIRQRRQIFFFVHRVQTALLLFYRFRSLRILVYEKWNLANLTLNTVNGPSEESELFEAYTAL